MQKKIIALAVAGLASTAAFAQSNVTIYGVMDVGYTRFSGRSDGTSSTLGAAPAAVTNGAAGTGAINSISSGNYSSSRLGFRGEEALGNGMKASFVIETNLSTDGGGAAQQAGNTGLDFAGFRQIVTAVEGGFGKVSMGRMYTPFFSTVAAVDPFGATGMASAGVIHPLVNNTVRSSSAAMYNSPNFAGFSFAVMSGLSEAADGAATASGGKINSWNALYANGPLVAGIAQIRISDFAATSAANSAALTPVAGTNGLQAVSTVIGGTYDFGVAKVHAAYNNFKTQGATALAAAANDIKHGDWHLGVSKTMGAHTMKFAYNRANDKSGGTNEDAHHYGLGYDYALSKRTALYALYAKVNNKNGAIYSVNFSGTTGTALTHGASAGLTGNGGANNRDTGMALGIRHSF